MIKPNIVGAPAEKHFFYKAKSLTGSPLHMVFYTDICIFRFYKMLLTKAFLLSSFKIL